MKEATGEYHEFQDPCGFENEEASAETLMKFVDRIVYASRAKINCSVLKVGVACPGDSALTWCEVPLAGTIPGDALHNSLRC